MILKSEFGVSRNEAGEIEQVWVTWTEAKVFAEAAMDKLGEWALKLGFAAASVGSVYALAIDAERLLPRAIISSVLLFGLFWWLAWHRWRVPGQPRTLIFHRDGSTTIPWGLSTASARLRSLSTPHSQIVSIEAEQVVFPKGDDSTTYTHGVRLVYGNGHIDHIAKNLEPDDAHLIAVRLTQALMELREEMANEATPMTFAPPQRRGGAPRRRERIIN